MALAFHSGRILRAGNIRAYPGVKIEAMIGNVSVQLYHDKGGMDPATQIVSDANGYFYFWVESGDYDLQYSIGGVVLPDSPSLVPIYNYTRADDLASSDEAKGAALIGYKARTVASKLSDTVSVEDFAGTDPATEAVNNAPPKGSVEFTERNYTLPNPIFAEGKSLFGSFTIFSGPNAPKGIADVVAVGGSSLWRAVYSIKQGDGTLGSANEQVAYDSLVSVPTTSAASYQKTSRYMHAQQYDSSDYGAGILRDGVGAQMTGEIMPGNAFGRAWGAHSIMRVYPGADGYAVAHEFEGYNNGTAQTAQDTPTTKNLIHTVAKVGLITAAIKATVEGTGLFYNYIYVDPESLQNDFLYLRDQFRVKKNGGVVLQNIQSFASDAAAAADASLESKELYLVAGSTTLRVKP